MRISSIKGVQIPDPKTSLEFVSSKYYYTFYEGFWFLTGFIFAIFYLNRKFLKLISRIQNPSELTIRDHKLLGNVFKIPSNKIRLISYIVIFISIVPGLFNIYLATTVTNKSPVFYSFFTKLVWATMSKAAIIVFFGLTLLSLQLRFREIIKKLQN